MKTGVRLTKEEVQSRINKVHNFTIIMTNYRAASKRAHFECKICGYEWETQPRSIYYLKTGCPMCSSNAPLTTDEFSKRMKNLVGNEYTLLSECNGRHAIVKIKHNKCGLVYDVEAGSFLSGRRCPNPEEISKRIHDGLFVDKDEMIRRLKHSWNDEMQYVSGFESVNDDALFRHKKCGKVFRARPRQLYNKFRGCTYCSYSKGEIVINNYLEKRNIKHLPQYIFDDCKDKRVLPFDYAVFNDDGSLNCLIEYQGQQHYQKVDYFGNDSWISTTTHDVMKKDYCKKKKIKLLCIPCPSMGDTKLDELESYVLNYLDKHMSIPNQAM